MNRQPLISVIIPVHNGGAHLDLCLDALISSVEDFEIILVDDASTDASAGHAHARGLRVLRLDARSGPAAARNRGAQEARAPVLLFIDADVAVQPTTLARVATHFQSRPELAALFGSYDDGPAATNFVSQYKNLFHHFVHQQGHERAETFWAGCGAVRREAFLRVGQFDEKRYTEASIEDIELGYRLRRAGYEILLDRSLQVCHLKRWTLPGLLRADIFRRAVPWSSLLLERGGLMTNDLNLRRTERLSAIATVSALALLPFGLASPFLIALATLLLMIVFVLNRKLYLFFLRRRGFGFLAGAVALHLLYYCYSSAAFALCCLSHAVGRNKTTKLGDEVEVQG